MKQRSVEDLLERDDEGTEEMLRNKDDEIERLQQELAVSRGPD